MERALSKYNAESKGVGTEESGSVGAAILISSLHVRKAFEEVLVRMLWIKYRERNEG